SSQRFGEAYAKALLGAGVRLPLGGTAFISVNDNDKRPMVVQLARELQNLGFQLIATTGTREFLVGHGVDVGLTWKVHEMERPNILDRMINGEVTLVINTPYGKSAYTDDTYIRRNALQLAIPCITTLTAAIACVEGIRAGRDGHNTFASLQEQHGVRTV
ncbi:MAG: carbamoyl-phosphate synthase large subunit, partial [Thermoanaerobaculia bacterium]